MVQLGKLIQEFGDRNVKKIMLFCTILTGLFGALPARADTMNMKVCRISFQPASDGNRLSVGTTTPGTACPDVAGQMTWFNFLGPLSASRFTFTEAELLSMLQLMQSLVVKGQSLTFNYIPSGLNQVMAITFPS